MCDFTHVSINIFKSNKIENTKEKNRSPLEFKALSVAFLIVKMMSLLKA